MFNEKDLKQIAAHGLTVEAVEHQIENFRKGFPSLQVVSAASPADGITILTAEQAEAYAAKFDSRDSSVTVAKFVPASGAATRMFKELFEFVNEDKRGKGIDTLLQNIEKFAFYPELKEVVSDFSDEKAVVSAIIKQGLGYGSLPKGLVTFHSYSNGARKAVEEHLVEGALYGAANGVVRLHFTVSPEHEGAFRALLAERTAKYEALFGVKYDISFSQQKSSTDTIAVNPDNTPFRTDSGDLLFRPAGHGALIENLNEIEASIIFVKNIDNVTTDALRADTVLYKKALAGLLLDVQKQAFETLAALKAGTADLAAVATFVEKSLCVKLPATYDAALLEKLLSRPIRVCGMVRNEGEPGGGPFWVANGDGTQTLQIAESSQISAEDMHLMKDATHFNPVDLVCGVYAADGSKYNLLNYTDPATGFISSKSSGGRDLRAQELPGLWNGAMADWNTIFVDVPISTFSPVKVVQDLLRPQHQ
ncbi:MAG: DUF4301 family protein [Alistipes sp.]|nr:DUF4301 family protein [Alistipes sp.]MBQ9963264.1 DUF4301 family protein [Alistipes sp.]MBR2116822.1 DUF4301 family protein [Alistipes sp.]